ncbi:MAG: Rieske (2Fe-2S) protein [Bryobacterales bacterium]|nr:Rieske (2Fe-2S) protein [Bryobacterales bacterium]
MAFVRVASASRLREGNLVEVEVAGRFVAVCRSGGAIYAMDGICPHSGGPLGQGALHGTAVVCPWHAWEFDCRTGILDYNERIRVPTFAVRIEGDDILADLP